MAYATNFIYEPFLSKSIEAYTMERKENADYDLCFPNFPQLLVAYLHWCMTNGKAPEKTALEALEAHPEIPIRTIVEMFPNMSDKVWKNICSFIAANPPPVTTPLSEPFLNPSIGVSIDEISNEELEPEYPVEEPCIIRDHVSDREYTGENIGRSIKALYETGWHVGKVLYWNHNLGEFKIEFPDRTIDYIKPDDIDDVEIMWN